MEIIKKDNCELLNVALFDADNGFLIKLRFGKGFEDNKVKEIIDILNDIKNQFMNNVLFPKSLCNIFFDFSDAIDGCLSLYSEKEQQNIIEAVEKIKDAIRNCLL